MKIKFSYLLPILAVLITGCAKVNQDQPVVQLPTGTFTGQFFRIHANATTKGFDTLKANLQLSLSASTGFKVTGDTTLHAGSFGSYAVNAYYIQFNDQTVNTPSLATKYHLNGVYNYEYNGTQLAIYVDYTDTLSYQYILTKSN
jgi:hypothetical protein